MTRSPGLPVIDALNLLQHEGAADDECASRDTCWGMPVRYQATRSRLDKAAAGGAGDFTVDHQIVRGDAVGNVELVLPLVVPKLNVPAGTVGSVD